MMYLVHSVGSHDDQSSHLWSESIKASRISLAEMVSLQSPISVIAISALAALGMTLWVLAPIAGKLFLIVVLLGGAAGFCIGRFVRIRRKSVAICESGFRLNDRHGARVVSDDQITSYAVDNRRHYRRGKYTHATCLLTLWFETEFGPERVSLRSASLSDDDVNFQLAIDRIRAKVKSRSVTNRHQYVFDGDGWSFERTELRIDRFGPDRSISLQEISAIKEIDGALLIWDQDRTIPVGRIPIGTRNADLLKTVVDDYLSDGVEAHRPTSTAEAATESSLGRMLFERSNSRLTRWAILIAGVVVLSIGIVLTIIAIHQKMPFVAVAAALFALAGMLIAAAGFFYGKSVFQAFENGIRQQSLRGNSVIAFEKIGTLTYQTKPEHIHHIYSGQQTRLVVTSIDAPSHDAIDFVQGSFYPDDSLTMIRDRASFVVARRMRDEHAAGRVVEWVPGIELGIDSIVSKPKRRWYRPKASEEVPYESINSVQFEGDTLVIWTDYQERAVLKISSSEPNFYPGYYFLAWILQLELPQH